MYNIAPWDFIQHHVGHRDIFHLCHTLKYRWNPSNMHPRSNTVMEEQYVTTQITQQYATKQILNAGCYRKTKESDLLLENTSFGLI